MTVHRWPSWRWYPHDWLRYVMPFMIKHYSRRLLTEVQPDVVHIQSHIIIGRGLTRIARQRGIPVVATNHVMPENLVDFTIFPDTITKFIVKLAWEDAERTFGMTRAVTTPTRKAAEFLEQTIAIQNVIPVSCGIDKANYTADLTPRDANRILFVGRLTTEKRIDQVLRAIKTLDPALDVHFDIVGGGDQRRNLEAAHPRARPRAARHVPRPHLRRGSPRALHAGERLRDRVGRRTAVDRDDGGDGLRPADRRGQCRGAAAPRARRRERLPLRTRRHRRPSPRGSPTCSPPHPKSASGCSRPRSTG